MEKIREQDSTPLFKGLKLEIKETSLQLLKIFHTQISIIIVVHMDIQIVQSILKLAVSMFQMIFVGGRAKLFNIFKCLNLMSYYRRDTIFRLLLERFSLLQPGMLICKGKLQTFAIFIWSGTSKLTLRKGSTVIDSNSRCYAWTIHNDPSAFCL